MRTSGSRNKSGVIVCSRSYCNDLSFAAEHQNDGGGVLALRRNPFFYYPIVNVHIQMPNSHNKRSFGIITRLGTVMFNSSMPMIAKVIITKTVLLRINLSLKLIP